jgi:Glyoxalase-like domain
MKFDSRVSRRLFLVLTGGAALAPQAAWTTGDVPSLLDHILLGCSDLDSAIDSVAQHTGVRAAFGGVHPARGTRNALLSLGERRYLEVIAPDPKQNRIEPFAQKQVEHLKQLTSPHLIGWAAHPGDLGKFAARLRQANLAFDGPRAGSRQRPDGKLLQWKTLNLKDDQGGLLPFFIEWSADSLHPSTDAPRGCTLAHFGAVTPKPDNLSKLSDLLQLGMPVLRGDKTELRAVIIGPKGELALTS